MNQTIKPDTPETSNVVALRPDGGAPAVKQRLTFEQAQNAARDHARNLYNLALDERKTAYAALEQAVGGKTDALDDTTIRQGEAWMTRLALIANRLSAYNHAQHGAQGVVTKAVTDVSGVVARLRAATLIHRADNLFKPVEPHHFVTNCHDAVEKRQNPLAYVAEDMRPTVQAWLNDNVEIVKPEPPKPQAPVATSPNGPTKANSARTGTIVARLPIASDGKLGAGAGKAGNSTGVEAPAANAPTAPAEKPAHTSDTEKPATTKGGTAKKATPAKSAAKKGAKKR